MLRSKYDQALSNVVICPDRFIFVPISTGLNCDVVQDPNGCFNPFAPSFNLMPRNPFTSNPIFPSTSRAFVLDEREISTIRPALSVSGLYQINNQFSVKIGVEHLHNLPVSDITLVNIGIEYNF